MLILPLYLMPSGSDIARGVPELRGTLNINIYMNNNKLDTGVLGHVNDHTEGLNTSLYTSGR